MHSLYVSEISFTYIFVGMAASVSVVTHKDFAHVVDFLIYL